MIKRLAIVAFLAVCAVGGFAWWHYRPIHLAEQVVRGHLKDPDSAKFHLVEVFRGTQSACGYVNAKNAMGGYVGFTHFVIDHSGQVTFQPQKDTEHGTSDARMAALNEEMAYRGKVLASCHDGPDRPKDARATQVPGVDEAAIKAALEDGRRQSSEPRKPVVWPKPPSNLYEGQPGR